MNIPHAQAEYILSRYFGYTEKMFLAESVWRAARLCRAHIEEQERRAKPEARIEQLLVCIARFCGVDVGKLSIYNEIDNDPGPPPKVDAEEMQAQLEFVKNYMSKSRGPDG